MKAVGKGLIFLMFNLVISQFIVAEESTKIGQFVLPVSVINESKTFVNHTSEALVLEWQLSCTKTDVVYVQNPIIGPGASYELDLVEALKYVQSQAGTSCKYYKLKLSLGVVVKAPIRPRTQFDYRKLKVCEKGLRITENDFIDNTVFTLSKAKNGKISYKAGE